jgi:hypothetical protein
MLQFIIITINTVSSIRYCYVVIMFINFNLLLMYPGNKIFSINSFLTLKNLWAKVGKQTYGSKWKDNI